jgi:hypothetical protein
MVSSLTFELPQRLERRAQLGREELRLLSRREVAALLDRVVIDQLGVRSLRPAPRGMRLLAGKTLTATHHDVRHGAVTAAVYSYLLVPGR